MNKLTITALGAVLVASANAQFLMDQIGPDNAGQVGQGVFASQDLAPGFPNHPIAALDDFTIAGPATITSIEAVMGRWNNANLSWDAATGYKVMIYSSVAAAAGNFVGDVYNNNFTPAQVVVDNTWLGGVNNVAKFTASGLNININAAGTYFLAVAPVIDFATAGQSGIVGSIWAGNTPGGQNAWQTNPGGGFAFPGNMQQIVVAGAPGADLAYRISGTVVPEPGTFVAIGLGLAGLALARRRK